MSDKATPRPWNLSQTETCYEIGNEKLRILVAKTESDLFHGNAPCQKEAEANGKLIVTAVNEREELCSKLAVEMHDNVILRNKVEKLEEFKREALKWLLRRQYEGCYCFEYIVDDDYNFLSSYDSVAHYMDDCPYHHNNWLGQELAKE